MNQPDLTYGPNTELVEKFLAMISSGDVDWTGFKPSAKDTVWDAAWYTAWYTALDAALDASRGAAWDAAWDAAWYAAKAAWYAANGEVNDAAWYTAWYTANGEVNDAAWAVWCVAALVVIDLIDQETIDTLSKGIISIIPDAKELFVKADSNKDAS
jgi:hypothetical protein